MEKKNARKRKTSLPEGKLADVKIINNYEN